MSGFPQFAEISTVSAALQSSFKGTSPYQTSNLHLEGFLMFTTSRASLAGTFCLLMLALKGKLLQELVAAGTMDLGGHRDIRELGVVVHTWEKRVSSAHRTW